MRFDRTDQPTSNHAMQAPLLTWYVNGTLGDAERSEFERHLADCAACRADLALERDLYAAMSIATPIDYVPAAALQRLRARIDDQPRELEPSRSHPRVRMPRWLGATAASVALLAAALAVVIVERREPSDRSALAAYHTVTSAQPKVPDEVIRAVFAPSTTVVQLQALLDEAQLRIVAGPTGAGVYSLAATSTRPSAVSLRLLRQHAEVRFAETTQPDFGRSATR